MRFWTPSDRSYRHFDLRPAMILEVSCRFTVNPVPRTYVRGFRACPSARSRTFTPYSPRSNSTAVLERGSRTGRSVVRGKSISLARPDAHQGLFHERNNFGSGLSVEEFFMTAPWSTKLMMCFSPEHLEQTKSSISYSLVSLLDLRNLQKSWMVPQLQI